MFRYMIAKKPYQYLHNFIEYLPNSYPRSFPSFLGLSKIRYIHMNILAIETSCDETAAAVVQNGVIILSNIVASSTAMHAKYGGIVPEVAAREQLKCIIPTIKEALVQAHTDYKYIDALAVTVGPGLIGSLLVGVETAKTLCFVTGKPIIPVNHVLAHMYANFVRSDEQNSLRGYQESNIRKIEFPAISLVVSGGHTELYLMKSTKDLQWLGGTLDDAAGEAFDKTARLLGFENHGGPAIQEAAEKCRMQNAEYRIKLPRPMMHDETFNFSFSGLKTAILREVNKFKASEQFNNATIAQLAFEVQESISDVLVAKTLRAAEQYNAKSILLSGGVAANLRLREKFSTKLETLNPKLSFFVPPVTLCTDN